MYTLNETTHEPQKGSINIVSFFICGSIVGNDNFNSLVLLPRHYDFETILSKTEIKKTENLQYTNKHIPVSFSIFSNVEGFNIKPIHVVNNNPKELIDLS